MHSKGLAEVAHSRWALAPVNADYASAQCQRSRLGTASSDLGAARVNEVATAFPPSKWKEDEIRPHDLLLLVGRSKFFTDEQPKTGA